MTEEQTQKLKEILKRVPTELLRKEIKRAVVDQTEANKYRANFYKGRFEAFRESLNAILNHDITRQDPPRP